MTFKLSLQKKKQLCLSNKLRGLYLKINIKYIFIKAYIIAIYNLDYYQYFDYRQECFSIPIPPDDPNFTDSCMNFVRSAPAPSGTGCQAGKETYR